jgi:hypothetical protein
MLLFAKYNENDEVKEHEMGWVCSRHGEERNTYMTLERYDRVV